MSERAVEDAVPGTFEENGRRPRHPTPGRRERCPTCRARRRKPDSDASLVCHRCGADLSLLVAVESAADRSQLRALEAYRGGRYHTALEHAADARRIEAEPATTRLLAVAALRSGDFRLALRALRDARQRPKHLSSPPDCTTD